MTFYDPNGDNNTQDNPLWVTSAGVNATAITAGTATATVIKDSPGLFYGFVVTSIGVGAPSVFDNASTTSGTIVGQLPASAVLGPASGPSEGVRCENGITVSGGLTNPGMTILWK